MNPVLDAVQSSERIVLFGAQAFTFGIYVALQAMMDRQPLAFIVTRKENNPDEIDGIKVYDIAQAAKFRNCLVIVAVPEIYHFEIRDILRVAGFNNVMFLDCDAEYSLMASYFREKHLFTCIEDIALSDETKDISIFMVKSVADKPLRNVYAPDETVRIIQAGAALTQDRIAELVDNTGSNISCRNRNYSELTVTYWVWKNVRAHYKGVFHYRRILEAQDWSRIGNVDVVLPLPFMCYPNASAQYKRYVSVSDFEVLMDVLHDYSTDYYNFAEHHFSGPVLYNGNLLVAKEDIFDSYCQFLFDILSKVDQRFVNRQDRYLGYLGELLTSLFMTRHAAQLRIVHAKKRWLL